MNPIARGDFQVLVMRYEHVILIAACRLLANTFVQASGGMSATAEVLLATGFDADTPGGFKRKFFA